MRVSLRRWPPGVFHSQSSPLSKLQKFVTVTISCSYSRWLQQLLLKVNRSQLWLSVSSCLPTLQSGSLPCDFGFLMEVIVFLFVWLSFSHFEDGSDNYQALYMSERKLKVGNAFHKFCFAFVLCLSFKNRNCTVTMHCLSHPVISGLLIPTLGLTSIST